MEPQMMNQELSGMTAPDQIQAEIDNLSAEEKQMAKQSLMEIKAVIQQLLEQGATEEEIMQMLADLGITMEQLEFAEQLFSENNDLGINI
jgi:alkylhydroperoxidase/carboxymuconolactone decarboxylase family protein YurZ|tara:strand:+ start:804 stop:1073 length:270 start_codon:yes stop_codon:yes gene_type:complete